MGSCEAIVRRFVGALCIACLLGVVLAQSGAEGPSRDACPAECVGKHCARYWWTTMWGFLVTLAVLTMDVWGAQKVNATSTTISVLNTFSMSVFNPLYVVFAMLEKATAGMIMVSNLREVHGDEVVAPFFPWSKAQVKIIVGTGVVVNLSPNVHKEVAKSSSAFHESQVEDFSEAVVVGAKVEDSSQYNVDLTHHGVLALLRANVLPPYDQLKILRGNSTLGMIVAAAQAIGYLYAIVVRCIQGLQVSPVEVIASCMNIVILMKVVLHNYASIGHRPLLLYLTFDEEARFIEECKNVRGFEFKTQTKEMIMSCIAVGGLSMVVFYFIISFERDSNWICMVPVVLFQGSLVTQLILAIVHIFRPNHYKWITLSITLGFLMTMVGYVWAVVVSFKYWKAKEFDVQSSNYLSQVLPYIG